MHETKINGRKYTVFAKKSWVKKERKKGTWKIKPYALCETVKATCKIHM